MYCNPLGAWPDVSEVVLAGLKQKCDFHVRKWVKDVNHGSGQFSYSRIYTYAFDLNIKISIEERDATIYLAEEVQNSSSWVKWI